MTTMDVKIRPVNRFGFSSAIIASTYHFEWLYLLLTMSVLASFDIYKAVANPLWVDEFWTFFIAKLPTYAEMLKAMPVDEQPPLNYLVTHFSISWFGTSELAIRLPELLAYIGAGLLTYRITRLHGSPAQSLFAMTVVMHSTSTRQAFTARPYGMLLAFTAVAFLSWQRAASSERRRLLPLCGIVIGLAGAILSHQFGILQVGFFLAVGETVRFIQRRRIDWSIIAAGLIGSLPLVITVPLALESHRSYLSEGIKHSVVEGTLGIPALKYYLFEANVILLFFPFLIGVPLSFLARGTPRREHAQIHLFEWAVVLALCLLLPLVLVVCMIGVGQFVPRYAIGSSLGLAVLAAWLLPKFRPLRNGADLSFVLSTVCFLSLVALSVYRAQRYEPIWHAQPQRIGLSPLLKYGPTDCAIVVANAFDYPQEWWYSPPQIRNRLVYLADMSYAVTSKKDFQAEMYLLGMQKFIPMPIESYAAFMEKNSRFYLLSSGVNKFVIVPERLFQEGWRLTPLTQSGRDALYLVERQ